MARLAPCRCRRCAGDGGGGRCGSTEIFAGSTIAGATGAAFGNATGPMLASLTASAAGGAELGGCGGGGGICIGGIIGGASIASLTASWWRAAASSVVGTTATATSPVGMMTVTDGEAEVNENLSMARASEPTRMRCA